MPCLYRSVFVFVGFCFLDLLQYLMSFILLLEDYISITGLGPYPLSLGMVYPRQPHRLWRVLTLNLNRTTATIQYTLCFNTFFSTHFLGWGSVLCGVFFFFFGGGGGGGFFFFWCFAQKGKAKLPTHFPSFPSILFFTIFFSCVFLGGVFFLLFFFLGGGYHNQLQILHISTCKSEVCMRFEHCAFTFNTFLCVPC